MSLNVRLSPETYQSSATSRQAPDAVTATDRYITFVDHPHASHLVHRHRKITMLATRADNGLDPTSVPPIDTLIWVWMLEVVRNVREDIRRSE